MIQTLFITIVLLFSKITLKKSKWMAETYW